MTIHFKAKKGTYILIISVSKPAIVNVGQLGELQLLPRTYLYVGSALGTGSTSLQNRLVRHLLKPKRLTWHIDFITALPHARVRYVVVIESSHHLECLLSRHIARLNGIKCPIKGFGSSDCSTCETHFYSFDKSIKQAVERCKTIVRRIGFIPKVISINNLSKLTEAQKVQM
ncbi:MAG: DUF123 domain-containing protein [Candidatus Heimdallarchaeota archaeon]